MNRLDLVAVTLSVLALVLSPVGHLVPASAALGLWACGVVVGHVSLYRLRRDPVALPFDVRLSRGLLVASWISVGGVLDPLALSADAAALWAGLLALVTVAVGTPRGR